MLSSFFSAVADTLLPVAYAEEQPKDVNQAAQEAQQDGSATKSSSDDDSAEAADDTTAAAAEGGDDEEEEEDEEEPEDVSSSVLRSPRSPSRVGPEDCTLVVLRLSPMNCIRTAGLY